jgi:hypothetical protein
MLNPIRQNLEKLGRAAAARPTSFQAEVDAALKAFRAQRASLERQVRRGDLTPKVARAQAGELVAQMTASLEPRARQYSSIPRIYLDRLVETAEARSRAKKTASIDALLRETNRLLRDSLIEQQIASRSLEFESRAFVRPMTGGSPAPTLDGMFSFLENARLAGDEAAQEWARRQLEALRARGPMIDPDLSRRLDAATDRPDQVNPKTVSRYLEALEDQGVEARERFVAEALQTRDANACCAAFLMARDVPEGTAVRWVRAILDGVGEFPDAAIEALRTWEVAQRQAEQEAARSQLEYAAAVAQAEAKLADLVAPSESELRHRSDLLAKPIAQPGEAIGLTLERRGRLPEDAETEQRAAELAAATVGEKSPVEPAA